MRKPLALIAPLAGLAVLAGCAEPTETVTFKSQQERVCYERVSATLPPNHVLRRAGADNWVKATIVNGLLRDVQPAPEFADCMVAEAGNPSFSDMGTITLTPDEQVIWNSLSDQARRDALEFIANGGTLAEFAAQ